MQIIDKKTRNIIQSIPNIVFNPHPFTAESNRHLQQQWSGYSLRQWQYHLWPYRYFVIEPRDQFETDPRFRADIVFNVQSPHQTYRPDVWPGSVVVGFRRQSDRNRWAKKHWHRIIGWAGGQFVY